MTAIEGQPMERPTDPNFIAYPGTANEVWWDGSAWVPATTSPIDVSTLVQAFNAIRNARTTARHEWEKHDLELEADQHIVKVTMLELLNKTGAKSIATDFGTVYRSERIKPSAADWKAVYDWIVADPDRFELLEKRLKSTFVKDFMEENDGHAPPGVNVHREYEVVVRRSNTTSSDQAND